MAPAANADSDDEINWNYDYRQLRASVYSPIHWPQMTQSGSNQDLKCTGRELVPLSGAKAPRLAKQLQKNRLSIPAQTSYARAERQMDMGLTRAVAAPPNTPGVATPAIMNKQLPQNNININLNTTISVTGLAENKKTSASHSTVDEDNNEEHMGKSSKAWRFGEYRIWCISLLVLFLMLRIFWNYESVAVPSQPEGLPRDVETAELQLLESATPLSSHLHRLVEETNVFEGQHQRARLLLPKGHQLRSLVDHGIHLGELRKPLRQLQEIHSELVGNVTESRLAYALRTTVGRLAAANAKIDTLQKARALDNSKAWSEQWAWFVKGGQAKFQTSREAISAEITQEHNLASHMQDAVSLLLDRTRTIRNDVLGICGTNTPQRSAETISLWTKCDHTQCYDNGKVWEIAGRQSTQSGDRTGEGSARVAIRGRVWQCESLDSTTSEHHRSDVSLAYEVLQIRVRWQQVEADWASLREKLRDL